VDCFKARVDAKGYSQTYGFDYEQAFADSSCQQKYLWTEAGIRGLEH
jgi:hypothetical protein